MSAARKHVLVLYWHEDPEERMRAAIHHHLRALDYLSGTDLDVVYCNVCHGTTAWLRHRRFDAILLHNTLLCLRWSHLFEFCKWRLRWVRDSDCPKIALPQDEYDHSEVLDEWLHEWGVAVIFTNFGVNHRRVLYPIMHDKAHFCECFTGYVDDAIAQRYEKQSPAASARPYDVVYRATRLPYWFGSHGQLKHRIAEVMARRAEAFGLRVDISTRVEDTIVGDGWLDFLASGRVVIGCESGSSVLDRRGEIRSRIQALLRQEPGLSFEEVRERLPKGWDDYHFFAISPRHFEAIITKTCQVLVRGAYDGVLEPDKHYIALEPDFSNIDKILERIGDRDHTQGIAEQAYEEIYRPGEYSYRKFAADIQAALASTSSSREILRDRRSKKSQGTLARDSVYAGFRGFSAMTRYYLYPGKAIMNKPLKPFLAKCLQYWRGHDRRRSWERHSRRIRCRLIEPSDGPQG